MITIITPNIVSSNFLNIKSLKENFKIATNDDLKNQNIYSPKQIPNFKEQGIGALAVDINGSLYVGTNGDGLYKSTDGINFNQVMTIGQNFINDIVVSNQQIYISTNGDGLYKSTDGGANFNKVNNINYVNSLAVDINGNIFAGTKTDGLYKSTNGGITFSKVGNIVGFISKIIFDNSRTIWITAVNGGLYKSTDGINFNQVMDTPKNIRYNSLIITNNDIIYMGTFMGSGGLWVINFSNNIVKIAKPDYYGEKYDGFIYKSDQNITIKAQYLDNAILDGNILTIPSQNIPISVGKHTLILTLKNEYKQSANLFNADNNGQITYNFLIKTSIDPTIEFNYKTVASDTDLLTGLISSTGNTNNSSIIQTRAKQGTGSHGAPLIINLNSNMFALDKSYYIQGIVDNNNNFSELGTRVKNFSKNLVINIDGIYHLHLVDVVGNIYDSYLEIGQNNWKLQGAFNDQQLNDLSNKLNVTVNLTDPTKKQEAMGWLQNYQSDADKFLNNSAASKGKGFNIDINDLTQGYKEFLDSITYTDISTKETINQDKLNKVITTIANKKLQNGLLRLPHHLNVDTSHVVNKSTLDSYSNWIKNYQQFINKNKDQWITDIVNAVAREFATSQEIHDIKNYVTSLDFSKFLKQIVYLPNYNLATSNDYNQFIELDKLEADTLNWVNNNFPVINQAYQNAINQAESKLNLHGYSIDKLLNGKSKPQTKSEIDNFTSGQSYHDFLQSQVNTIFKSYQLKMGLGIGIPLALFSLGVGIFLYWRFNKKNQPYSEKINKN